jgi:hypothetical protein
MPLADYAAGGGNNRGSKIGKKDRFVIDPSFRGIARR